MIVMQALSGFARKYAIMEELDEGFGTGSSPEAFVRLDSWEGRITASLNVKGLKQGPYAYVLYLIFAKGDRLTAVPLGNMRTAFNGMQSGLEVDASTLAARGLSPENVRYAAITAESNEKKWIPLFSSFEKNYKWDESIRQILLRKAVEEKSASNTSQNNASSPAKTPSLSDRSRANLSMDETENKGPEAVTIPLQNKNEKSKEQANNPSGSIANSGEGSVSHNSSGAEQVQKANDREENKNAYPEYQRGHIFRSNFSDNENPAGGGSRQESNPATNTSGDTAKANEGSGNRSVRCDMEKLENMLIKNYEGFEPFNKPSRGYTWYRVSDLANLSNIMYTCGVNVPVFANPKILVGLFKYKHILAGLYKGEDRSVYFVIGVPAKDDQDNKPFENACRWVGLYQSDIRDLGGYWLVYVSMKSGEIVV